MATPTTRIPKAVRYEVKAALHCFRDYLAALDNKAGAHAIQDVTRLLGLGELEDAAYFDKTAYTHLGLKTMLRNRKQYGPR